MDISCMFNQKKLERVPFRIECMLFEKMESLESYIFISLKNWMLYELSKCLSSDERFKLEKFKTMILQKN